MSTGGLACPACGGLLHAGADPGQLRCGHCGTDHLAESADQLDVLTPSDPIRRGEAVEALTLELAARGLEPPRIERSQLVLVPYWNIEAKIIGWQQYRLRDEPNAIHSENPPGSPQPAERDVEETVAKDVRASYPACDARGIGLLGVAHRLDGIGLRPFSLEAVNPDTTVCAVMHPASTALRRARTGHAQRLLPRRARAIRQRTSLVRVRTRLVYYPVWRICYGNHLATVDGVRGTVLQASGERLHAASGTPWLAAAAASGFVAGFHVALGVHALALWALSRVRAMGGRGGLAGGLSRELGAPHRKVEFFGARESA